MQHWIDPLEPSRTRLWFRAARRSGLPLKLFVAAIAVALLNTAPAMIAYPSDGPHAPWGKWVLVAYAWPVLLVLAAAFVKWGFTDWRILYVQESNGGADLARLVMLWRLLPEPERTQMAPVARAAYAAADKEWASEIDRREITVRLDLMKEMAREVELAREEAKQEAPDLAAARNAIEAKRFERGASATVREITERVEREVSGE